MANSITESKNAQMDVAHPAFEIVEFTTAGSGDYYDCKKLDKVEAAFVSQDTADGRDIQVSFADKSNGQPRVTLTLESGSVATGYLVIVGRL